MPKVLPIRLSGRSDDLVYYRDEKGHDTEIGTLSAVTFTLTIGGIVVAEFAHGWEFSFPTATAIRRGKPKRATSAPRPTNVRGGSGG